MPTSASAGATGRSTSYLKKKNEKKTLIFLNMTEKDIIKWGEIQYLTGRLDELIYKAVPNVLDLHGTRMLDVRVQKYLDKLKAVDEIAYFSYLTHRINREHDKARGQKKINDLLESIKQIADPSLAQQILDQQRKYNFGHE